MNRFICLELEGDRQNAINFGLFKRSIENADSINIDGVVMPQYENSIDTRNIEKNYYQYGSAELLELFEWRSFDGTVRTISELATARGITINTNFGTFIKDFMFYYNRLLDLHTNIWWTVFDGNGELHFLKPERDSDSAEITNYDVLIKDTVANQNVNYEGESGADFTIAVDTKCVVPVLVDDDIKQMIVNKYNANLKRLTISTRVDVNVLDYVIEDGDVYVILSKKLISGDNDVADYECRAVKEVVDSLSFSGADVVPVFDIYSDDFLEDFDTVEKIITTYPTYGNYKDVSFPSGFNANNSIFLCGKISTSTNYYYFIGVDSADTLFIEYRLGNIRIHNNHTNSYFDNKATTIFIVKHR